MAPQNFSFCSASQTPNGFITLNTRLTSSTEERVAYSQEISNALEIIDNTTTNIYSNTRMLPFVIHSVPRNAGMETTRNEMDEIAQETRALTSFGLTVLPK